MTEPVPDPRSAVLRKASAVGLVLVLMAVQFSIGVAHALFALTLIGWIALLIVERRRPQAPRFAIPLGLYAVLTLVSAILSTDPTTSVIDSRQLFLFLLVPMTYDLITSEWADNAATAVLSAGAVSGLVGIGQYAILNYNLDQRPHGTLGMYMTYSGLTMLIVCLAVAQVLFARNGRTLGRTGRAGAGGCSRGDVHAEHVDWRLLGGRRAVPDEGFPSARRSCRWSRRCSSSPRRPTSSSGSRRSSIRAISAIEIVWRWSRPAAVSFATTR